MVSDYEVEREKGLPEIDVDFYKKLGEENVKGAGIWFQRTRVGNNGVVYVPDDFTKGMIVEKYGGVLRRLLGYNGGNSGPTYVVDGRLGGDGMAVPLDKIWGKVSEKEEVGLSNFFERVSLTEKDKEWNNFQRVLRESEYPKMWTEPIMHGGIEKAVSTFDIISSDKGQDGKRYLLLGNRSAGKSTVLAYGAGKLISDQLSVAYLDLNWLSEYMRMNYKDGAIPPSVKVAYNADVLFIDELRGLHGPNGTQRPGTQRVVRALLDDFNAKKKTVVMAYTGSRREYDEMVKGLETGGQDAHSNHGNADLGSRLEEVIEIGIKPLQYPDRADFVKEYLVGRNDFRIEDVDEVAEAIHNAIPIVGASTRRIIGAIESVFHDARCDDYYVDAARVVSVLGKGEGPRSMLGNYAYVNQAFADIEKSIFEGTSFTMGDLKKKSSSMEVVHLRDLIVYALDKEGQHHVGIGKIIGKDRGTVKSSLKKIELVLGTDPSGLSKRQTRLRNIIEDWERRRG